MTEDSTRPAWADDLAQDARDLGRPPADVHEVVSRGDQRRRSRTAARAGAAVAGVAGLTLIGGVVVAGLGADDRLSGPADSGYGTGRSGVDARPVHERLRVLGRGLDG